MRADPFLFSNALAGPPTAALPAGRLAGTSAATRSEAPGPHDLSGAEVAVLDDGDDTDRPSWRVDVMALGAFLVAFVITAAAIGLGGAIVFTAVVAVGRVIGALLAIAVAFGI